MRLGRDVLVVLSLGLQRGACLRSVYRRGLRLCVVDVWPFVSPHNLSDFWCVAKTSDCRDLAVVIEQVVSLDEVCGVVTFREHLVMEAAQLAEYLGLPGLPVAVAESCRNKGIMRKLWGEAGLDQPRWQIITKDNEEVVQQFGTPAVIKPIAGTAGRGVQLLTGRDRQADKEAVQEIVRKGQAVLEEYVVGREFSVELVLYEGEVLFSEVTEKDVAGLPAFIEVGHTVPADISSVSARLLIDHAVRMSSALGVDRGVLHVELKLTEDGPSPIEIAARPAADHIPELVYAALGVDLYGAAIDIARGVRPVITVGSRRAAAIAYGLGQPGTVTDVSGVDDVLGWPQVMWAKALVQPGDQVRCQSNHDRTAVVMVGGDDAKAARSRAQQALDSISVIVTPEGCKK